MKKEIGLLALTLALSGALVGCSNQNASVSPMPTAPAVAPTDSAKPSDTPTPKASDNIVGKADNAMRDAGNAARNAVDDIGDAARNAADGIGDMARGAMDGLENATRGADYGWADNVPGGYNGYGWGPDGSIMENGSYYSYNVQ